MITNKSAVHASLSISKTEKGNLMKNLKSKHIFIHFLGKNQISFQEFNMMMYN